MPSQDDLINSNREAMRLRAEARSRGEVPGRSVPLSRGQARARIKQLESEINRLREVPPEVEQLRSELTSVRAAHAALISERDNAFSELEQTKRDLATLRNSIKPAQ